MTTGYICSPPIYEYKGIKFEVHPMGGPWPLKKDGEPREKAGRKFYAMFLRFMALPEEELESYRIGGGCRRF